jgi:hypothetical protein
MVCSCRHSAVSDIWCEYLPLSYGTGALRLRRSYYNGADGVSIHSSWPTAAICCRHESQPPVCDVGAPCWSLMIGTCGLAGISMVLTATSNARTLFLLGIFSVIQHRCESGTTARLLLCPLQLRESLLGCLAGYAQRPKDSRWCMEHLLGMLLNNEARGFPQVWINREVVGTLGPVAETHLPHVAKSVRTFNADSRPMRMLIVRAQAGLLLGYKQWILRSPTQRTERVLAYRTRPARVCTCCQRSAFWKLPQGGRGCSSYILRLVAEQKVTVP